MSTCDNCGNVVLKDNTNSCDSCQKDLQIKHLTKMVKKLYAYINDNFNIKNTPIWHSMNDHGRNYTHGDKYDNNVDNDIYNQ